MVRGSIFTTAPIAPATGPSSGKKHHPRRDLSNLAKSTAKWDGSTAVFTTKGPRIRNCGIYFDRPVLCADRQQRGTMGP
ncbi:hypothetical protein BS47DRAFT_1345470, partial [Hydnum rufescens UP504]